MQEIRDLLDKANNALDTKYFSKQDIDSIKSTIKEVKNMEKAKVTDYAEELAKNIKEYSDNNNNNNK